MNAGVIILVIVGIILLAAAIIFLVLWLNNRNKQSNVKKELAISNVQFSFTATSITATWDNVGNAKDMVTLYADTSPINIGTDGKPSTAVAHSQSASGTARTVTINGLTANTKYYVALVVTQNGVTGFNSVTDIIFTGETIPSSNFIIQEINTPGAIALNSSNPTIVTYQTGINKTDITDIWTYDTTNFTISTRSTGVNSTAPRPTLYNNNGVLAAQPANNLAGNADAQWTYNVNGNNRWCLRGTTNCMTLTSPISNGAQITITSNPTTKWINIPSTI